jgi:hypothetical protein
MNEYDKKWIARVLARSVPGEGGCILWTGNVNRKGYGQTVYRGRTRMVHRKLFELRNGLTLDRWTFVCHHCDTPNCVAEGHLWRGSPKQNSEDATRKGRHHNTVRTHCRHGHEYTPENTFTSAAGFRNCITCQRIRQRVRAGWPRELADSMPAQRPGARPVNARWADARK